MKPRAGSLISITLEYINQTDPEKQKSINYQTIDEREDHYKFCRL